MAQTLPTSRKAFFQKQKDLMEVLLPLLPDLEVDMEWVNKEVLPAKKEYEELYRLCADPLTRERSQVILRDDAYRKYRALLAQLIAIVKAQPKISLEDLVSKGIAVDKGGGHHPKRRITDVPDLIFDVSVLRVVKIVFGPKPKGVQYVEILLKRGGAKPEKFADFEASITGTNRSVSREYDEGERYTSLYVMARYVGLAGELGAWSGIYMVMIP
jgi:hypothetical protein